VAAVAVALAALTLVAVAWWEGRQWRDSAAAHWSVAAVIGGVLVLAGVAGVGRQRRRTADWLTGAVGALTEGRWRSDPYAAGVAVWALLLASVVAWDLVSFVAQSHGLPTLSRLFGHVTRFHAGRAVVFGGWLLLGGALALGQRSARPPGGGGRRGGRR
jgi:hypothetical protein